MLPYTFDQDPENPLCFTWSEVYKNDDAFLAHLANPPIGDYLQGHAQLGEGFTVEVSMEQLEINAKMLWRQQVFL